MRNFQPSDNWDLLGLTVIVAILWAILAQKGCL